MILDNPKNIQFCNVNLLENAPTITTSSQLAGYEFTKALTYNRQETFKPTGRFLISATNNLLYFNDGSNKIATIPALDYSTGALLAVAIQTALNTISSGFTVSYTNNLFIIARSSAYTLRLSQTTNTIHYSIGFTSIIDLSVLTSAQANEKRCHYPYEEIQVDFGHNAIIDFFAMIGRLDQEFQVSDSATIIILANNINDFTTPQLNVTAYVGNKGAFYSFNEIESAYRYWRIRIQDFQNPLGSSFEISNCYLGQGQQLEYRNVSNGFDFSLNDTTGVSESESGVKYFDQGYKFFNFGGLNFSLLNPTNLDTLINLFDDQGINLPFYLCIDPKTCVSTDISKLNRLVRFSDSPRAQHVFYNYYSVNANFTEHF